MSRPVILLQRRLFCSLPDIQIPFHLLEFNAVRSSGPGGQNVNKVNSKAELRFKPAQADWIPEDIRNRLIQQHEHKINKFGELIITSQEHRTLIQNRDVCVKKLKEFIQEASIVPKERVIWENIGEKTKDTRKKEKSHRSKVKSFRGGKGFDY